MDSCQLGHLTAIRMPASRIVRFEHDVTQYRTAECLADLPASLAPGPSYVVAFHKDTGREPLLVDRFTARILELSDGSRSNAELVRKVKKEFGDGHRLDHLTWIENLFLSGLIDLQEPAAR